MSFAAPGINAGQAPCRLVEGVVPAKRNIPRSRLCWSSNGEARSGNDRRKPAVASCKSRANSFAGDVIRDSLRVRHDAVCPGWVAPGALASAVLLSCPPALSADDINGQEAGATAPTTSRQEQQHKARDAAVHFLTGGIGGCVGAAAVFPIDLVKTRLQAQKEGTGGGLRYKGGIDCFWTVLREEGPLALYSGLSAQLIGVWPEKAVKLTANDFVRGLLTDPLTGNVPLSGQMAAGAFGGLCQVAFTNPLEIVKIQLQLDGERGNAPRPMQAAASMAPPREAAMTLSGSGSGSEDPRESRLAQVVKQIGFFGLYQGAGICAARDMFFSAMYFPLFSTLKDTFASAGHQGGLWLLLAGTLAGAPAAYFSTPFDMIKTRAQAEVGLGEEADRRPSAAQCLEEILDEGGWAALFTGGVARVIRSAPQFGVTLFVYDQLNTWVERIML